MESIIANCWHWIDHCHWNLDVRDVSNKNEIEAFEVLDKITNDMSDEDLYSLSVCCQAAQDFRSEKLRIRLAKVCMKFLRWYSIWGVKSAESAIRKASQ